MAPSDRDERTGPSSLPTPASVSQNQSQSPQETIEKYKKLKRRYVELEEVRVHIISFFLIARETSYRTDPATSGIKDRL
jgi:hypothetical protein